MEETLEEKPRSLILELMKNLRIGMDLSKVVLPVFVLEPRSLLEKLTDFLSHAQLLIRTSDVQDPLDRMVAIVRWYLSGWHVRPKGVKKPYNPILGEVFRCKYDHENTEDGVTSFVSEQVSHHPPVSAFYVENRKRHILFSGSVHPRSKFLGNSVASLMEGESVLKLLNLDEEYVMNWPNVYARGLIYGTLLMEIGGSVSISCSKTGLSCKLEFTTKGFFTGEYNRVRGSITNDETGEQLFSISGLWDSGIDITNDRTGETKCLFDPNEHSVSSKTVSPVEEQEEFESRRLWQHVTQGILARDLEVATKQKTVLEEAQRKAAKERAETNQKPKHRLFHLNANGIWTYNHVNTSPYDPKEDSGAVDVLSSRLPPSSSPLPPTFSKSKEISDSQEETFKKPPPHEVDANLMREAEEISPKFDQLVRQPLMPLQAA